MSVAILVGVRNHFASSSLDHVELWARRRGIRGHFGSGPPRWRAQPAPLPPPSPLPPAPLPSSASRHSSSARFWRTLSQKNTPHVFVRSFCATPPGFDANFHFWCGPRAPENGVRRVFGRFPCGAETCECIAKTDLGGFSENRCGADDDFPKKYSYGLKPDKKVCLNQKNKKEKTT